MSRSVSLFRKQRHACRQSGDGYLRKRGSWKGRYTVIYGEQRDDIRLAWKDARSLGINTTSVPAPAIAHGQVQLRDLVQGGEVKTDTSTLSLALTVPQAAVQRTEEGYIAPSSGTRGIPALMLSWNDLVQHPRERHCERHK